MIKSFLPIALVIALLLLQNSTSFAYSVNYNRTNSSFVSANNNGDLVTFDNQMLIITNYPAGTTKMTLGLQVFGKTGYAALYVAALYNNTWYFWDSTKPAANRWVAISDVNAAMTLPEVAAGNYSNYYTKVITEMIPLAHGAAIYVGVGFGNDSAIRKKEMLMSKRFRFTRTIP